jgi:ribose transport system substrate-binding protein
MYVRLPFAAVAAACVFATFHHRRRGRRTRRKITIGLVAKSQIRTRSFRRRIRREDAAKELGGKYNADITIDWQTPTDEDAQKQAEAIDALARNGAQGISVSCSEANTVTPAINRAVAAGSIVMCFDSDAPRSKRMCYYGTDDATCERRSWPSWPKRWATRGRSQSSPATSRRRTSRRASRACVTN